MRKGIMLMEVLVVIAVIALVSIPFATLSVITLRDIPRYYRMISANTSMLNLVERIRDDVNSAKRFPESFNDFTAGTDTLLIEQADQTICYKVKDNLILRKKFRNNAAEDETDSASWEIPHGKLIWRIQNENDKFHSLELETYIEIKTGRIIEKKLANSYLFFAGAYKEPENHQ